LRGPPDSVRAAPPAPPGATRVVLVRHGEAACNVNGVVGGRRGCTGLTGTGVRQVEALRDRLARTGELGPVDALYSSVLARAVATAEILAPVLERPDGGSLRVVTDCGLCELHPGEADAVTWAEFSARFGEPDWDRDPTTPLAPGGESWSGFVDRAASCVARLATRHRGGRVVLACHAGVIEATVLAFFAVDRTRRSRGLLRTEHASLTEWELAEGGWRLCRYNDVTPWQGPGEPGTSPGGAPRTASVRGAAAAAGS